MACLQNTRKNSVVWPRDMTDDPAFLASEAGDRDDHMETTNRPSRPDRLEIFWNDWGDRDDPDDHMETRLKGFRNVNILLIDFWLGICKQSFS